MSTCVIIGAGHAGCQVAFGLRRKGWEGRIVLLSNEAGIPYQRPPLSKDFLLGKKSIDQILLRQSQAFIDANIELMESTDVSAIDRDKQIVVINNDEYISYDKIVMATGSRVRKLVIDGVESTGVMYVKTVEDVTAIKARIKPNSKAVIIGGGYIGLEAAAVLRLLNVEVSLVEACDRILQRVTAEPVSDFYQRIHEEQGVGFYTGVGVKRIDYAENSRAEVKGVTLADDTHLSCDIVIVGIGVLPNQEVAEQAGLKVSNGIEVNEYCQTTDDNIYAIGDCTYHYNPSYDAHIRLECVQNANDQANSAVLSLMGEAKAYDTIPWFWSDQYDLKLQIVGLSQGYDQVVIRGESQSGQQFSAFYLKQGKLIAVDAINTPRDFTMGKRLLMKPVDADIIADPTSDLKQFM